MIKLINQKEKFPSYNVFRKPSILMKKILVSWVPTNRYPDSEETFLLYERSLVYTTETNTKVIIKLTKREEKFSAERI